MEKYDNLKEKIFDIIVDMLGLNKLELDKNLMKNNIEKWDSLKHISIITKLEEVFDIQFEPEEIVDMNSVEMISIIIKNKL